MESAADYQAKLVNIYRFMIKIPCSARYCAKGAIFAGLLSIWGIKGSAFGGIGLSTGMAFGGIGLSLGMALGGIGLSLGVALGGIGLSFGTAEGGAGGDGANVGEGVPAKFEF